MKRIVLLLLFTVFWASSYAQEVVVKGVVRDGNNQPQVGATISEKGTSNAVIAGAEGQYQIKVKANAVLVFTYLGTKKVEESVNNRTTIDVKLLDDQNNLNEVVVTGYGQKIQRKDLTGAISSIKGEEIAKMPVQNVAQALQGRIAGMQVAMPDGTPGAAPSIVIRGGTSITQSNEPLYVVDGVPQTDGLSFLDPMDIESVDVLKDASATAIYGARGANGVILVTTKQIKEGKVTINYDGYVGAKTITNQLSVMNPYDYTKLLYERSLGDLVRMGKFTSNYGTFEQLESNYLGRPGINWQDEVMGGTALNQYHKISFNGGNRETKFNLFYSLNKDEGSLMSTSSDKNIAKLTVNHNVNKKFSIGGIVNYSNQKITGLGVQEGGVRTSIIQSLIQYRPLIGINGTDEDLIDFTLDPLDPSGSSGAALFQSPIVTLTAQPRNTLINTLNANATAQYNLTDKIVYRGLVNYTQDNRKVKFFNEATSILALRSGGAFGGITTLNNNRFNYSNTLSYNNTFNKVHKLDLAVGQEYIENYSESFSTGDIKGFPVVNQGWDNLSLGTIAAIPTSLAEDDKLLSFFGRANYGYKGKYLLTTSLRLDGSSKFGKENRWGLFPSAAFAWRAIEEDFMKSVSVFSDLKFRLSYGEAGNNRIANYAALGIFTNGVYPLGNQVVTAAFQQNLPNPYLKWESVRSLNVGLDLGLFKQRVTLTAEWYDNRSKDLLFQSRIPASSGFVTQIQNIGTTSSRGVELSLNTNNIKSQNFNWSTNFNVAFSRTKVLSLSDGETSMLTTSYTDKNDFILTVGRPVGIMYGYIRDGLYQVSDFDYNSTTSVYTLKSGVVRDTEAAAQPGFIKFKDISGPNGSPDGVVDQYDRTTIGNANPKFTGGINNTFSYKGFDLSVFLNFSVGNDIYNANVLNNSRLDFEYQNTLAQFADRWTTINSAGTRVTDPAELTALNQGKTNPSYTGNSSGRLHSDVIENGSFLRLSNLSLGYTFDSKLLSSLKINKLRVYLTANNLYTFTNYSGYDPEVSVIRTALTPGVDYSAYPRARSFVAGINLSL
ncbi:TonB-dependent receptor [Pedobacter frigoris]|uniref:SusC/RagA family TonB-linked outer membrane protein n=1 Tax=Pedobacter frigoris TaxID=2571272 RepID=UPI0029309EB8|nr:TonB-dependent receptor [Pedobacter frigoris]